MVKGLLIYFNDGSGLKIFNPVRVRLPTSKSEIFPPKILNFSIPSGQKLLW